MSAVLDDLFRRTYDLAPEEARAALARFPVPAGLANGLFVGRRFGGPVDLVVGGPCTRNDLQGISLGTFYQIVVPLWAAAALGVRAAIVVGIGEEALVNPRRADDYRRLGDVLRIGIERVASDLGVAVDIVDTSRFEVAEALEAARAAQRITVSEPESRWLYELSSRRTTRKPEHSAERRHATGKVLACHTGSFLRSFFGYANPLIIEDVEAASAALFADRFGDGEPVDVLAFLPLPTLRGDGPMFPARNGDRVVLGVPPRAASGEIPPDVRRLHDDIAAMLPLPHDESDAPSLTRILAYASSRFASVRTDRPLPPERSTAMRTSADPIDDGDDDESPTDGDRPLLAVGTVVNRRMLSGLQPSGTVHLGNYYGAMQQHIDGQADNEGFFFIANYHAMSTVCDAGELTRATFDVAVDYLALGLDPNRVALYRQTDVPEVTELAWILSCVASFGDLERAVSFKDKVSRGIVPNVALFTYPILMAADILITRADVVPVGEDQLQHIEMTRRFAGRFNRRYGRSSFVIPQARLNEAKTVPGIDGQKMSKSYGNAIPVFGEPASVRALMFSIKTDSLPVEAPKNPDTCFAFSLLRLMAPPPEVAEWRTRYAAGGLRYSDVKQRLVELYEARFGAARERRRELLARPEQVEEILRDGARKVRAVAIAVMADVRDAVGIPAAGRGR